MYEGLAWLSFGASLVTGSFIPMVFFLVALLALLVERLTNGT